MSNKNVEISQKGFNNLINQIHTNIQEERELALDRYRTQDDQCETIEDFIATGKEMVSYLKVASERTNAQLSLADKLKDIVFKTEEDGGGSSDGVSDDIRKSIENEIAAARQQKEDEELTDGVDIDETETEN